MPVFYRPRRVGRRDDIKCGDILINTNTFKPAHCGIVVKMQDVIHATRGGIVTTDIDQWADEADMFRPRRDLTDKEIESIHKIASEIQKSAEYGKTRAVFKSTFSSGSSGAGMFERLIKYNDRLQSHQGLVKNVYCSELVILTYQLAWAEGKNLHSENPLFIALDGKHTWPSTLRRYLRASPAFRELGTFVKQEHG